MTASDDRKLILIDKYLDDELTPSEEAEMQQIMEQSPAFRVWVEELGGPHRMPGYKAFPGAVDLSYYHSRITTLAGTAKRNARIKTMVGLFKAAILVGIAFVIALLTVRKNKAEATAMIPGVNESYLLLPDSRKLLLSSLPADTTFADGWRIQKDGNELTYSNDNRSVTPTLHRLYVEPGKHYLLRLPDSSRVSVSDSSAVNFLLPFNTRDRIVTVSGQARFKVEHQQGTRFRTRLVANALDAQPQKTLEAEALGTTFSVRAYPNETTQTVKLDKGELLLSGQHDTLRLFTGQQATLRQGSKMKKETFFTTSGSKADRATGHFWYQDTDIQTIMNDIAPWYDVKVIYTGDMQLKKITLSAYSTQSLNEIMKMISDKDTRVYRKGPEVHVIVSATAF
jgi:transmembrane sensor